MAFLRYANAAIVKPFVSQDEWVGLHAVPRALSKEASAVVLQKYDPSEYLLTHATIIASVDTEDSSEPLGRQMVNGFQVDRRFSDWLVTLGTQKYINSNRDAWERRLLLSCYKTFIGAENYCFLPDTHIVMADGTTRALEDVKVGDLVLTHTGSQKRVLRTFTREVNEDVCSLYFDRSKRPVRCTENHPFRKLDVARAAIHTHRGSKPSSTEKYRRDSIRKFLRDGATRGVADISVSKTWEVAGDLRCGDLLLGPMPAQQSGGTVAQGTLLGYYLAEGSLGTNCVIFTFGDHESALVDHVEKLAREVFPACLTHRSEGQSTIRLTVRGLDVFSWFSRNGGQLSESKRISSEVLGWSEEALTALLAAWATGDAQLHKKTRRIVVSTVSRDLAQQARRVAEIVGVKASLWEEQEEGFLKRQQRTSTVLLLVGGAPKRFTIRAEHSAYNLIISKDSVAKLKPFTPRWAAMPDATSRKREDFAWHDRARVHTLRWSGRESYCGVVHNIEVEGDNSYVLSNGIAVHNCEHVQIPELSKGKIIDAASRDIGDSIYVDILVATARKHKSLISAIESKRLSTLSMGCSVAYTQCTKCGNVAEDEAQMCPCVRYSKGNEWYDSLGNKRITAELCGHRSDPESVKFIEASWVANPAFKGAVMRSILSPEDVEQISKSTGTRMQVAFNVPVRTANPDQLQKAAKFRNPAQWPRTRVSAEDEFDMDQAGVEPANPAALEEKPDPLGKAVDSLVEAIREKAIELVRGEIGTDEAKRLQDTRENTNNTLVKEASKNPAWLRIAKVVAANVPKQAASKILSGLVLHKSGGWRNVIASRRFDGREMLVVSRLLDILSGKPRIAGESRIYRTVLVVGGPSSYPTIGRFLQACRDQIQRPLTEHETRLLVQKGRIYELGSR
jgi:hypothetical protein